jgi:hypothetical protein
MYNMESIEKTQSGMKIEVVAYQVIEKMYPLQKAG